MMERSIILSAHEVRAALDGRLTQIRRPIGPAKNPLALPVDRLWVKENCARFTGIPLNGNPWAEYIRSPTGNPYKALLPTVNNYKTIQKAKESATCTIVYASHMPRWASRITLEVLSRRIERLQEISEADALAEGIRRISHGMEGYYFHSSRTEPHPQNWRFPEDAFRELWDTRYAKRGFCWDANPLVWVAEVKRV